MFIPPDILTLPLLQSLLFDAGPVAAGRCPSSDYGSMSTVLESDTCDVARERSCVIAVLPSVW